MFSTTSSSWMLRLMQLALATVAVTSAALALPFAGTGAWSLAANLVGGAMVSGLLAVVVRLARAF